MVKNLPHPDKEFLIRCPKLGHQIYFAYCKEENFGTPCVKTLDCWFQYFPVKEYLQEQLSPEKWRDTFEKPRKPKVLTLVELIDQAKKIKKESL